ncbi:MAG: nuclear transport factor 2 family protein [Cytophagales bacterium]|nr:nuclear transport factor 2 family protein [Cytophagales bacterium]
MKYKFEIDAKQSNQAIANHDSLAVADFLTEDFHIVSSRNSESSGRDSMRQSFSQEFKVKPDVIYIRTPVTIQVYENWDMASEIGTWTGQWQEPDGLVKLTGSYYAKWHKVNGTWKIRAELFTPLTCEGSKFCDQKPMIE